MWLVAPTVLGKNEQLFTNVTSTTTGEFVSDGYIVTTPPNPGVARGSSVNRLQPEKTILFSRRSGLLAHTLVLAGRFTWRATRFATAVASGCGIGVTFAGIASRLPMPSVTRSF